MNWFKFSVEWERRKQKGILDQPEAAKESVYSWAKWGSEEPPTPIIVERDHWPLVPMWDGTGDTPQPQYPLITCQGDSL